MTPMDHRLLRPRQGLPGARTLYYVAAFNSPWATAANWYLDAEGTQPAGSVPGPRDTAVVTENYLDQPPPSPPVVRDLVLTDSWLEFDITVLGLATFNGFAVYATRTLVGNAVFNNTAQLSGGTVVGNAVFNDNAANCGTVTGTATINGTPFPCS